MYPAILGIRNSFKSKDKSDSEQRMYMSDDTFYSYNHCIIGAEDEKLIKKLLKSPAERKFLRQILVSMDIKASIKAWGQIDTYKIGTVRNSESTMHCITAGQLYEWDFESKINKEHLNFINRYINEYNNHKSGADKEKWEEISIDYNNKKEDILNKYFELIDANLPAGYLLWSQYTCNYEVLRNIYNTRKGHKMFWWKEFCGYIEKLPYFELLIKGVLNE